jgi:hypothetical protein
MSRDACRARGCSPGRWKERMPTKMASSLGSCETPGLVSRSRLLTLREDLANEAASKLNSHLLQDDAPTDDCEHAHLVSVGSRLLTIRRDAAHADAPGDVMLPRADAQPFFAREHARRLVWRRRRSGCSTRERCRGAPCQHLFALAAQTATDLLGWRIC